MKLKKLILIMLILCATLLPAADNKFLRRIYQHKHHPSFGIAISGDKVISRGQNQVWIYSIFNPWQPQIDASYFSVSTIEDVELMGDRYLFVSSREPTNTLLEVDSLNVFGKIFFPTLLQGDSIEREGSILYVSDLQRGIEIIDIGSGGAKETKSVFSEKWGIRSFVAEYPYIYALNDFGLVTVDVSNLSLPQSVGLNYELIGAKVIAKHNSILWVGAEKNLYVIDITRLDRPVLLNQYRFAYDINALAIKDGRLFVALGFGGVRILDINNPVRLEELNWINLNSSAMDLALYQDYIFISSGNAGWIIYEYR